jgi:hypothetical protein
MGPVEDVFDSYDAILHKPKASIGSSDSRPSVANGQPTAALDENDSAGALKEVGTESRAALEWLLPEFSPIDMCSEYAQCLGGTVETLEGVLCGRPQIHTPFRICLRYRLLKDCPHAIIPSIRIFDSDKRHVLISTPSLLPGSSRGTYIAYCRIEPFTLNYGRYSVGLGLSSVDRGRVVVHFHTESMLRFEVTEPHGVDPRRHGYEGEFGGTSRLRLDWRFTKLVDEQQQQHIGEISERHARDSERLAVGANLDRTVPAVAENDLRKNTG